MKVICVDDEWQILQDTLQLCRQMPQIAAVEGFTRARDALQWMETHPVELAILDIHMPEMDGLALAKLIRERQRETDILFLTAHPQYAADAWAVHPTGYILKPLTRERLAEELGVNPRQISAVVGMRFQQNYSKLVSDMRVHEAMYMLTDSHFDDMTMEDIAINVGFTTRQSFYADFNRVSGMTPREYRIAHRMDFAEAEE